MPTDAKPNGSASSVPKRGRPTKERAERKNTYVGFRVRDGMREKLQASADARGMSVSEEIERRLAFSFDIASTPQNEFIIRALAHAMNYSEAVMNMDWSKSPATSRVCYEAVKSAALLMTKVQNFPLHPEDLPDREKGETTEEANQRKDRNIKDGVAGAGTAIGYQTANLFFGKSIDEVRSMGADHIMAAKAFAERWEDEVYGNAGKREAEHRARREGGLGNIARDLPADLDEGEGGRDTAPAPVEQPAPTPARRLRAARARA